MLQCRHVFRTSIARHGDAFISPPPLRSCVPHGRRNPVIVHRPLKTACHSPPISNWHSLDPRSSGLLRHTWHSRLALCSSGSREISAISQHEPVSSDAQKRTIYALSTPPGKAGVAVIRISGPDSLRVWRDTVSAGGSTGGKGKAREHDPDPWKMHRCRVVHPNSGEILDDGLAVFFKAPKSFTTEDVLELHIHSGRAIISSVLSALSCLPYCRPANKGEFTRRAFEGGRLDLTQVEGLKDLIYAETESQRKAALKAAGGSARTRFEQLRTEIIQCLALVEALIDFGEGEDIEEGVYDQARDRVLKLSRTIQGHLSDNRRGEILRSGIRLTIFGPTNAGKSSLLNFLAQREAAIVTSVPGTTRDVLELALDIGGLPVIVADTAGLRDTEDMVEKIGVERAQRMVEAADVSLCVLSLPEIVTGIPSSLGHLVTPSTFILLNKLDLISPIHVSSARAVSERLGAAGTWEVSLSTGEGTQSFLDGFGRALQGRYDVFQEQVSLDDPLITHARHRVHLESALEFLRAFMATSPEDIVLGAEELRYAAQAVGKISGLIDVEDVLDAVFRDFCIGK